MKIEVLDRPAVLARIEKAILAIDTIHARANQRYVRIWRSDETERRAKAARMLPFNWLRGTVPFVPLTEQDGPPPWSYGRYQGYPCVTHAEQKNRLMALRDALTAPEFGAAYLDQSDLSLISEFEGRA